MNRRFAKSAAAALVILTALLGTVYILWAQIRAAIGVAACLERANYELVLCAESPADWQLAVTVIVLIGLSIALGAVVAADRHRSA